MRCNVHHDITGDGRSRPSVSPGTGHEFDWSLAHPTRSWPPPVIENRDRPGPGTELAHSLRSPAGAMAGHGHELLQGPVTVGHVGEEER